MIFVQFRGHLAGISNMLIANGKHTLPDLDYDYNALEPVISADIMKIHHQKHHAAYVNNLNIAEEKLAEAKAKSKRLNVDILNQIPLLISTIYLDDIGAIIALAGALKFNGGGHINHSIFWKTLSPQCDSEPDADLSTSIKESFGSLDKMKNVMSAAAIGVQGSGWAWLGFNPKTARLEIKSCPNQDPLEPLTGKC